ncbi:putative bifunctional diguanylate cyclase/phosphodiesterase [Reinekea marinisedimentorum]|uniref:Diguanylate cyclase (GGDEF)-like protein n=1 Tax=Reinekea marinisedimentorum TaxID=230495 RepID=A0A4R3I809_9GAMM|nr:EAL domain-containing protein [Reinekea marinisedimentorum]TCS41362.1 diguanylate cyclase (GGDEF)-like protein [Reinekea marinisedimentorum]
MKLQHRFVSILGALAILISLASLITVQRSISAHNTQQLESQLSTHLQASHNFFFEVINTSVSNLDFISQNVLTRQYFSASEQIRYQLFHSELTRLLEQYLKKNPLYSEISIVLPDGYKDIFVRRDSKFFDLNDFDMSYSSLASNNLSDSENRIIIIDEHENPIILAIYQPLYNYFQSNEKDFSIIGHIKISLDLQAITRTLSNRQLLTSFHYRQLEIFDQDMAQLADITPPFSNHDQYQYKREKVFSDLYIQSTQNGSILTETSQKLFWQGLTLATLTVSALLLISIVTLQRIILKPLNMFTDVIENSNIDSYKAEHLAILKDYEFIRLGDSFNKLMDRLKKSSRALKSQALTDELTGLPNRAGFYELIRRLKQEENVQRFSVLFLDLDGFKQINDNHGHQTGDQLLIAVARKLVKVIRHKPPSDSHSRHSRNDAVHRLGGDEFAIVMRDDSQAQVAANRIIKELQQGFQIEGRTHYTGVSIGIAVYPEHSKDIDLLIQYADIAMYDAKRNGKMRFSTFSPKMAEWEKKKLSIENAIREGMEYNRFETHFQPKINCETGEIIGVEALARLRDKHGQLVSPADFIPIAQEYGVLEYITYIVTEQSCQLLQILGDPGFGASVNISPSQLSDLRLIVDIRKILHRYGIETRQIEFEVTEEELIINEFAAKNNLEFIREFGFKTALDDFGAGYSSLGYLKKFRFDTLKLDQIFINTEDYASAASIAVIRSIKALAITLGMEIVAEGVETQNQVDLMQSLGIRNIQGYYYSKPVTAEAFIELYRANKSNIESVYTVQQLALLKRSK